MPLDSSLKGSDAPYESTPVTYISARTITHESL